MKPYFHNQQVLQNRVFTNQDIVLKVRNQGKKNGASERIRTVDSHVGNVILYQLSYTRISCSVPLKYSIFEKMQI